MLQDHFEIYLFFFIFLCNFIVVVVINSFYVSLFAMISKQLSFMLYATQIINFQNENPPFAFKNTLTQS